MSRLWERALLPVDKLSNACAPAVDAGERFQPLVAGTLVFVGTSTVAAAVLATSLGSLRTGVSIASLVLGAVAGALALRACAARQDRTPGKGAAFSRWDALALGAFLLASLRHFFWLCVERDGVVYTRLPNNYGDLPLHWTYIRYLANGASFWPENPIFTGVRLRYPFGVDLFTALFAQLGLPVPSVLNGVGVLASLLAAAALLGWGRGFALAALLLSGGLEGFRVLATLDLAGYSESLPWKNLFLALYLPQRGFLWALPAGLLLLTSWRARFIRERPGLPAWVEGLLWGVLPLFHMHTFLFVSVLAGLWALATRRVRDALPTLAWAFLPALWTVWQVTDHFGAASLVWWKAGWMMGNENPAGFLALNFGLFLPLAVWALTNAIRQRKREALLLLGPGLGLFVVLFFVMLAPWDWDNTKALLWCYVLVLPALDTVALRRLRPGLRALVLVGLFFSGAVALVAASLGRAKLEVLDVAEADGVCRALAKVTVEERVATQATFNHPVALCGHPLIAGYAGHLWSHGIDAKSVKKDLDLLLEGDPDWRGAARRVNARFLFWGWRERGAYPESLRPWEATQEVVAEGPWGRLYRLDR